jgi:hypothetical protein
MKSQIFILFLILSLSFISLIYAIPIPGTSSVLGYNRVIYVLEDRFGNKFYIPIDADFANITVIGLTVNPQISPSNSNQTTVYVNGTVGYYSDFGTKFIPLPNGKIYLYYDADINYVNYNPLTDPTKVVQCAFGQNTITNPNDCQLADPNYLLTLSANTLKVSAIASIPTYSPQYSSSGSCKAPSASLLSIITTNCNIYGQGAASLCPPLDGHPEFCVPLSPNGTGTCTSQLGLIGTATTNNAGKFTYNFQACGITTAKIIAKFYGSPIQPLPVMESGLPEAAEYAGVTNVVQTDIASFNSMYKFSVQNYVWAPNESAISTHIGLFEFSYGDISGYGIVVIVIFAILITYFLSRNNSREIKNKPQKSKKGSNNA